jgi:hypothetical protein
LRHHRQAIADLDSGFFMSYNGETVLDEKPLCFTMTGRDYINCRRDVNKKTTREFYNTEEGETYPSRKLPLEERWSAKNFNLSEVFDKLEGTESHIYEPDWFYDLSTWEGYRAFLASENSIKKPADILTKPHTYVKIPYKA